MKLIINYTSFVHSFFVYSLFLRINVCACLSVCICICECECLLLSWRHFAHRNESTTIACSWCSSLRFVRRFYSTLCIGRTCLLGLHLLKCISFRHCTCENNYFIISLLSPIETKHTHTQIHIEQKMLWKSTRQFVVDAVFLFLPLRFRIPFIKISSIIRAANDVLTAHCFTLHRLQESGWFFPLSFAFAFVSSGCLPVVLPWMGLISMCVLLVMATVRWLIIIKWKLLINTPFSPGFQEMQESAIDWRIRREIDIFLCHDFSFGENMFFSPSTDIFKIFSCFPPNPVSTNKIKSALQSAGKDGWRWLYDIQIHYCFILPFECIVGVFEMRLKYENKMKWKMHRSWI